jgi:hypothetical protein
MSETRSANSAEDIARTALALVLATQWDRLPAIIVNSPPGAGKTGMVERISAQSVLRLHERCVVVTQTNEQAFDLARRMAQRCSSINIYLMVSRKLALPARLTVIPNLRVIYRAGDLPSGPSVVIGNGAKWSWLDAHDPLFDVQIVDEAFQLPDYRFQLIANLAHRIVLIGDPGQIEPVIKCELERWRTDPAGPHVPCPRALLERHPRLSQVNLPVSRRLVADTVEFVQPAFYPEMPFVALGGPRTVALRVRGLTPLDTPLDAAAAGASIIQVQLPAANVGEVDEELASCMVAAIHRLIERGGVVTEEGDPAQITPEMIGVSCAHVSQVNAIRERLGSNLNNVFVETANRFQGLERPLMFVYHPLSGRADATEFHLDAGRLCVMLSRHRVACFVFARDGITRQLLRYAPTGDRVLGAMDDPEYRGWRAHLTLMEAFARRGRMFPVEPLQRVRRRA